MRFQILKAVTTRFNPCDVKPNRRNREKKKRKEEISFQNSSKNLFFKYSSHICKIFPIHRIKRMMEIQKSQSCFEIPPHESTSSPLDTPLRLSLHKSPALGAIFGPFPRRSEWKHLSLCLETKREREVRYACFESTGVSPSSRSLGIAARLLVATALSPFFLRGCLATTIVTVRPIM